MSQPTNAPRPPVPYVVLIVCATLVLMGAIGAFVALVLLAPPETDLIKIIGAVFGGLALALGQVANYLKTKEAAGQVDQVREVASATEGKVTDLTNGLMDAKLIAALSEVLPAHLIDPAAVPKIEAARARRDTVHGDPA